MKTLFKLLLALIPATTYCQTSIEWLNSYNTFDITNNFDYGTKVGQDASGNVYIGGYFNSSVTVRDYLVAKYNAAGAQQWSVSYNGSGNNIDELTDMVVDASGNVYVTGFGKQTIGHISYQTLKYNSSGTLLWTAIYSSPGPETDSPTAICIDASGNVYVTGTSSNLLKGATVKYNSSGVQQWVAEFDIAGNNEMLNDVAVDASGNVYVTGFTYPYSSSASDIITIKYNSNGIQQWSSIYNGPQNSTDEAAELALDLTGNVYVTGSTAKGSNLADYVTIKYNSAGSQQWVASYNGTGNNLDEARNIILDNAGDLIVSGRSYGSIGQYNYVTLKYNTSGTQLWSAVYNGPANLIDEPNAINLDNLNNIYITGQSFYSGAGSQWDIATIKYNSAGIQQWAVVYNGNANGIDIGKSISVSPSGSVYVAGYTDDLTEYANALILKYTENTITTGTVSSPICAGSTLSVPFTVTGTFGPGNTFTAQLSDASGSFSSPATIGTLTSGSGGIINTNIPSGTTPGSGYRIRVVSSTPTVTGTNNGSNLTINTFSAPAQVFSESIGSVATTTSIASHESSGGFDNDSYTMTGTGDIRATTPSIGYIGASGGANVFLTNNGTASFQIEGINTTGTFGLTLSFGIYKSTTASNGSDLVIEVSSDGVIYSPLTLSTPLPTGTGTAAWTTRNASGNIPAASNLRIRWRNSGLSNQYRLDDIRLSGSTGITPVITALGSVNFCPGGSVTLTATTPASSYSWSNGTTGQNTTVTSTGNYYCILTDANGCSAISNTLTVNALDTQAPAAVCKPLTVYLNASGTATISSSQVNNGSTDNCSIASLSLNDSIFNCSDINASAPAADLFFSEYVEGSSNNKYIEIFNGTGSPVNLGNYELRLFSNGAGTATATNSLSGTLNNGSTIVFRNSLASAYGGSSTVLSAVNWNGDDAIGLYKTSTGQYVDIFGRIGDDPGSAWNLSGNTTVDKTLRRVSTVTTGVTTSPSGTGAGAFTTLFSEWTQFNIDDVSGLGSHSFTPPPSTTPVTLTVTDVNGNSSTCISQVTVLDTVSPTVICQNVTISLNALGTATITASQIDNGSSDACGIAIMTVTPNSFTCLNTGPNNVVLTVTDINGNSASCTAVVTVQDNTPPNAICQNIAVSLDASGNASITASQINNGSNDNCGIATMTVNPSSFNCSNLTGGSSLPSDLFISEYTEGSSNNKCIEIFNGTGSSVNLATGGYQLQFYFNGATSSGLTISLTGTLAPNDVYVVCQASAAASFLAQADQTSGSGWYNGDDAVVLSKNSGTTTLDIIGRIGEDPGTAWGTSPLTTADRTLRRKNTVTGGVNTNPASGFPTLATEWDSYVIDDNANLGQHSIASGTGSAIVPVTLTVTDVNGNISSCVANVTVTDNTPPQAICQNITVALDANGTATISASQINNGSNDACGIASMTVSPNTFTCANIGPNTVTLTVTDVNGNTSTCTATVTIQDNTAPVAQCQSITVQLNAAGTASITASQINNGSSDNCSITNMTVNPSTFNCSDVAGDPATDLIISEYVEGSSSNKYIEIYNGTAAAINLSDYQLILYSNGSTTATNTNTLSGTLASGATAVYKNSAATVYTGTATAISSINFNGDDAVGLFKISSGQYVDIFGRIGEDPGTAWGTSPQNTVDRTLRRKPTVLSGVTVNPSSGFPTLTSEWDFFNIDVVSGLGSHSLSNGNLVTFTVTDGNGNSSSCTATVTVQDLIAPTAVCQPVTVQLNAAGTASVTAAQVNNGSSDNCGIANMTVTPNTFTCANVGPNTVTLTVTDVNGLSSTCTATVTVQDLISPTAVCQPVTVQLNAAGTASVTATQVNNGSFDNCGIANMTVTPNTFTCANVGPNTVTLTVTDVNGLSSTCTVTVTVQDLIAPTAVCQPVTVQLNAAGTASVTATQVNNGSFDNCSIANMTVTPNTFTCANVGPNTVTLTVTDVNGLSSTCTATVTVQDLIAPVAQCQNITVALNAAGTASITAAQINNGSTDACGISGMSVSPNSFNCSNKGPNTVTLTVTDINNNTSTCTAVVTIIDNTPPTAVCQNINAYLDASGNVSVNPSQINNGSFDNCGIVSSTLSPNTFDCGDIGANTVTLTLSDGIASVDQQNLNAVTISGFGDVAQSFTAGTTGIMTGIELSLGYNFNPTATLSIHAGTGAGSPALSTQTINLPAPGGNSSQVITYTLATPVPVIAGQVYTIALTNSFGIVVLVNTGGNPYSGGVLINGAITPTAPFDTWDFYFKTMIGTANTSTCTATVTVIDTIAPTASCQALTVQLGSNGTAAITASQINNGSSDACGIANMTVSPNSFSCANVGPNTVTLTVTDNNGNSSSCTTTVTVQDLIAPTAVCQPVTVQLDASGTASVTANQVNNGSFDNCSIQSVSVSPNSFTCANLGPNTVTLTVTDVNGLSSTCTSIVTVVDNIAPTISCPGNINANSSPSTCGTVVTYTAPIGTDNCQSNTLQTAGLPSGSVFPVGSTVNTFTVTDAAGNQSSCSFTVNVTDNQAPVITNCPSNITSCNPVSWTPPTITDNCPGVVITSTHTPGSSFPVGNTTVTYTATDVYGNTSSCSFVVNRLPESAAADSITSNRLYNNICIGSNITLTLYGGSLGSGASWKWYSGTCGGTLVGTGTSITVSPTTTTTYFVRAEGSCNTTTCASITVVVSTGPPAQVSIISAPASGAVGQSGTLTVSTPTGATYYQYTSNLGHISAVLFNGQLGPYTTSSNTVTLSFQQSLQNYQIRVIALNACGRSNTASAHIRGTVPAPSAITGTNIACPGQTTSYSIPAVTGSNNYVWTLTPSTAGTITGQGGLNITVNWSASFTTATLCVNGVTIFGLSGPQTCMTISNNAPAPVAVVGKTDPCPSSTETYTISPVSGAISYLWNTTVPGATISVAPDGLSASVTYPAGTFAGSICVSSSTSCGVSPATCLSVTNGAPGQPGPVTGPENGVCLVNGISYFLSTSDAVSYSWTSNSPNVNITSGNGTNSVLVDFLAGFTSGTLTVEAIYECGSSFSSINIDGSPGTPTVTPAVICPGSTEFYFASATGATSYTWNATGTLLDYCTNAGCSQYYVEWDAAGVSLAVTATNSCGTSAPFTGFSSCRIAETPVQMHAYPNPSLGIVYLELYSPSTENYRLEVCDLTGRAVRLVEINTVAGTNTKDLDLTNLGKGLYILKLTGQNTPTIIQRITLE